MNYARGVLRQESQCEEVVHEAFLKAYEHFDELKESEKKLSWMWSIVRNECLQRLRKHSTKKESLESELSREDQRILDQIPAEENDAETLLIEEANQEKISHAWQLLSDQQRDVLKLRMESELSLEEIATILKVPVSTVKSHIHRAKKTLIEAIRKGGRNE